MLARLALPIGIFALTVSSAHAICPYDANCINNPITGRNPVTLQGGAAAAPFGTYSTNQVNPNFGSNPLRNGGTNNPFASVPKPVGKAGATPSSALGGLGNGLSGSGAGLQGVDPDLRK